MKRIKEVVYYVEHSLVDWENVAANAVDFVKNMEKRRQNYGINNNCAASVGREGLTHEKAASRNHIVFYKDFLGRRVVPSTSHVSPGPQAYFNNNTMHKSAMAFTESRKHCLGYNTEWRRAYSISDNENCFGVSYTLAYC